MLNIKNRKIVDYKLEHFKEVLYCDDDYVKTTSVQKRNHLKIKLNNSYNNEYSFIFKNPSKAQSITSDDTINIILKFCNTECKVGIVNIFNVYPFYETDSCDLYLAIAQLLDVTYNTEMSSNLDIIEQGIDNSEKVIIGWGEKPDKITMKQYRIETNDVLTRIRRTHKVHCFDTHLGIVNKDNFPYHPIRKSLKGIVEYPIN